MKIKNAELMENIGKIVFYNNGKKVEVQNHQADSTVYKMDDKNVMVTDYMNKVLSMDAGAEFKRALKENLNRKDNFYMSYLPDYSSYKKIALYVYADFEITEVIDHIWDRETAYINAVTINLPFIYEETTREELPYKPDFQLPKGAAWYKKHGYNGNNTYMTIKLEKDDFSYKRRKKQGLPTEYIVHLTKKEVVKESHTFKVGPYTRITYTEEFQKAIDFADEFTKIVGDKISRYDVEKLLKVYNITKK